MARPPSPLYPAVPLPANVLMVPVGLTRRIRLFPRSVMYRFPALSLTQSVGPNIAAAVAGPPSPEYPDAPLPATVVIVPPGEIRRMAPTAAYRLPLGSNARSSGPSSSACGAGPPSPVYPGMPLPATVVMIPAVETFRRSEERRVG